MTPEETRALIAESRGEGPNTDELILRLATALETLTTPQEPKSAAKAVPVSYESSASCWHSVCPSGCSHLMWACSACSCEGGWGAPRDLLEQWAAKHVCPPPAPADAAALLEVVDVAQRRWNGIGRHESISAAITRAVLDHLRGGPHAG